MSDRNQFVDKIDLHYQQQLSALMDGVLAPDAAHFLLRRLQHDHELAGCWERWQIAGEVLRGRTPAVLPAAFAARVRDAVAANPMAAQPTAARSRPRWAHWGGGAALAASVAVMAMLVVRQSPDADVATQPTSAIVAASTPPAVETPAPSALRATGEQVGTSPQAQAARVAVVDPPRRAVQRPRAALKDRAATRAAADADPVEIAAAPATAPLPPAHPFATGTVPATRPWPRAVLPQFGGSAALTADTDNSPSFYPFEPRLPEGAEQPGAAVAPPR